MHKIIVFFDKLEDKIRGGLSHHPIPYALIGGAAIVLFWRGVWNLADSIPFFNGHDGNLFSLVLSVIVMMITGLFVSFFIGDRIILSGLQHDKKIVEKAHEVERVEARIEGEVKEEAQLVAEVKSHLKDIDKTLEEIEKRFNEKRKKR